MNYMGYISYLYDKKTSIAIQFILTLLTYFLVKFRYRTPSTHLILSKKTKEKLIKLFQPEPIVDTILEAPELPPIKHNLASYDIFNLGKKYKEEIKAVIREYGVGTCGPRGFYGTLDIHLELETRLAQLFDKEGAVLYSNYFTCVQSVIPCFCKSRNTILVHRHASEAIKSGAYLSRSKIVEYESLEDLKTKLMSGIRDRYVIAERIGKNTGKKMDLGSLIELKRRYGFRLILDEAFSLPFLYQSPQDRELYGEVDLIVGSLSLGYPTNGGFCVCCKEAVEYQRLSGASYVFSASLPAFLSKAVLCMMEDKLNYEKLRSKIRMMHESIQGIVSDEDSPIVLVEGDEDTRKKLREKGYNVGRSGEYLRICVNEGIERDDIEKVAQIINNK